ncbi:aldehyde dehydrogenase family protein [Bosea sp. 117]|uniref:aldehyde dehydrogenase family protein n=1 Tax=Bosea sp. 117 TaxID=1125973 RepID=UPI0006903CCD|nr:aldehyde dehydrogenase family protein [Bosea sp. 117]
MREYGHFIDGVNAGSTGGEMIARENPATRMPVASWPAGTKADVDHAVAAAGAAFRDGRWSNLPALARSDVLRKVAEKLRNDGGALARIESEETGKPLRQATEEVPWAGDIWDFAAGQARAIHGDVHSNLGRDKLALVLRQPAGVVALITPWNYPLVVLSQKLPFALAAGCSVVVKPSEMTSGTTLEIARILTEAGLPDGVFNVVTGVGDPVGQALAEHPDVRVISFTGSTATGRKIVQASAGNMKKVVLELGGKNPFVVFDDADLDAAVDNCIKGFVYNAGAECCSGSRVFVQQGIFERFAGLLTEKLKSVKVGDPNDPDTVMGALISETHFRKVTGHIAEARRLGTLLHGGGTLDALPGYFVEPTVIAGLPAGAAALREEIFGPVIALVPFTDTAEAIAVANDTEYGLASSIWTDSLNTANEVSRAIESGIVWVNTFLDVASEIPIGGIKQSGYGRENGRQAIEEFTVLKTIVQQDTRTIGRYLPG